MDTTADIPPDRRGREFHAHGMIGNYKLLGVLGEGGFGVVYEAEQIAPVRRRVAIKLIKPGMDSAAVVARFEAERQALAVMDHLCIAKVYDGGVTGPEYGSRPYFVMELVKGVPITEHCDTQQLTIDERCELFIRVCEAVQHAHTKGVVHRDLKPSNVLVSYSDEGHAVPKVIDFGVAKALNQRLSEKTIFTERGQLIGTPEYMSPEQAEMSGQDIDTRADVYSLGVLLYELLTGVLPFDPATLREAAFNEIQRIIRETEPPRPSTRLSTMLASADSAKLVKEIVRTRRADARAIAGVLKRDLDWVILHSLEKNRDRRYQTSAAIGADLHRFLAGEPVDVGPPSIGYRLSKFVRRNRSAVVMTTVVIAILFSGLAGTTYGLLQANEQAYIANKRLAEIERMNRLQEQDAEFDWLMFSGHSQLTESILNDVVYRLAADVDKDKFDELNIDSKVLDDLLPADLFGEMVVHVRLVWALVDSQSSDALPWAGSLEVWQWLARQRLQLLKHAHAANDQAAKAIVRLWSDNEVCNSGVLVGRWYETHRKRYPGDGTNTNTQSGILTEIVELLDFEGNTELADEYRKLRDFRPDRSKGERMPEKHPNLTPPSPSHPGTHPE